ncbi:LuxR C-terminal-related transcriptional regulator, partial [Priestia megaterium]
INLSGVNLDGIYTALELEREKTSKVIMLTSMSEEDIIQKAFMAGASDYILKKDVHRIPEIIRSNYNNESSPVEAVLKEFRRLKSEEQLKDLTNAEREVFEYIEKGYSRKKITLETHKSDNTLKTHFKNIFKKLSVSNTKDLINKVKTGGLK